MAEKPYFIRHDGRLLAHILMYALVKLDKTLKTRDELSEFSVLLR
jgi:hypothetical protein